MDNAVLYIVFNRPDLVELSLAIIREARPKRLYVAADGPRDDRPEDVALCTMVREIVADQVDWGCELITRYQDHNLGCGKAVSSAMDWFFAHEEQGIILEDDCMPHLSFFDFCDELLERYKEDKRIFQVSGSNWQRGNKRGNSTYYFSHISSVWGWATWKDRWEMYSYHLPDRAEDWETVSTNLDSIASSDEEKNYHIRCFKRTALGEIDTWDYQWRFLMMMEMGLNAVPNVNLVSNAGHRSDGTHTTNAGHWRAELPVAGISFPITHPPKVLANSDADQFLAETIWVPKQSSNKPGAVIRIKQLIKRVFS